VGRAVHSAPPFGAFGERALPIPEFLWTQKFPKRKVKIEKQKSLKFAA
jgi:hypothetical protein